VGEGVAQGVGIGLASGLAKVGLGALAVKGAAIVGTAVAGYAAGNWVYKQIENALDPHPATRSAAERAQEYKAKYGKNWREVYRKQFNEEPPAEAAGPVTEETLDKETEETKWDARRRRVQALKAWGDEGERRHAKNILEHEMQRMGLSPAEQKRILDQYEHQAAMRQEEMKNNPHLLGYGKAGERAEAATNRGIVTPEDLAKQMVAWLKRRQDRPQQVKVDIRIHGDGRADAADMDRAKRDVAETVGAAIRGAAADASGPGDREEGGDA
jgi:hypothetical protein